jgi:hypothetical protein
MSENSSGSRALVTFKILTPSEIQRLLEDAIAAKETYGMVDEFVTSSTFGADEVVESGYQAKIIPITAKIRERKRRGQSVVEGNLARKTPDDVEEEFEDLPEGELEKIGVLSWDKIKTLKERERLRIEKSLPSSTSFLLDALNSSKRSNHKLTLSSGIKTYKSKSETVPSSTSESDEKSALGDKGVLVNKDQY